MLMTCEKCHLKVKDENILQKHRDSTITCAICSESFCLVCSPIFIRKMEVFILLTTLKPFSIEITVEDSPEIDAQQCMALL